MDLSEFQVSQVASPNPLLKTVVILATGGTIAGSGQTGRANNYTIGGICAADLVEAVPAIRSIANLTLVQVCNLGSVDITSSYWLAMTQAINHFAQDESVAGFVVTYGTDTLDELAYWLNLTVKTEKPVVVTGSMRPATSISADGPMNLYQAVGLAASPEAAGRGVMVVFCDGIYGGRDVRKVNTLTPDAFDGRDMGRIGYMLNEVPQFFTRTDRAHTVATEFSVDHLVSLPVVSIAYFCTDADVAILDWMRERSDGIVIAGAGGGSMSYTWIHRLASFGKDGFPCVRASRVENGCIAYSGKYDIYTNVIRSGNLAPQKARILLQLALTVTRDISRINDMFNKY